MQIQDQSDESMLDKHFTEETLHFQKYLVQIKGEFDEFDQSRKSPDDQLHFLNNKKTLLCPIFDQHFAKIWQLVKELDKKAFEAHRCYYQKHLLPILGFPEVNNHIYTKPLGYAGDFITMNYILDQYNKFIGKTSFEKFVNNYTCSIPISLSNISRKEFLKSQLLNAIGEYPEPVKITSIASGPARELIDLLNEKQIKKDVLIRLFDFETKAFAYIKEELGKIKKSMNVKLEFIQDNLINLIRKPESRAKIICQDFIYAFGIYDYLNDIVALKLTSILFDSIKANGTLLICNASINKSSHRAYFELLGGWEMIYRTKEDMLHWTNKLSPKQITIRDEPNEAYIYLIIRK